MWGLMGWKVDLISFPTSTHGLSYLLWIKSYSCFFWWSELVVRSNLVLFWVRYGALPSCVHLSTTNVEHLGSITFLEVIKAQSVRSEFTCSCSFFGTTSCKWPLICIFDVEWWILDIWNIMLGWNILIVICHSIVATQIIIAFANILSDLRVRMQRQIGLSLSACSLRYSLFFQHVYGILK